MDIDIGRHIGAVTREVRNGERGGRPSRVVVAARVYDTSIEDLWDAITNRDRIPRWFLPISGDLRLGGRYQLQGNAGGEITRCDAPRHLAVTWEYGGDVSWLEVRLSEEAGKRTRLELEHAAHVPDEMWKQYGPGAAGVGWDLGLMGLDRYLMSGEAYDHNEVEAWSTSAEGKAFMRGSSDAWARASIASGTDESAALAAATRTTAFYTGEGGGGTPEGAGETHSGAIVERGESPRPVA